jgi:hypothetical protein
MSGRSGGYAESVTQGRELMMAITEKQFEAQVKDLAKMFGWLYYHTWRSIHSPAGFPDVVMVRPPRLIFAELKSETGQLTEPQKKWLDMLEESGYVANIESLGEVYRMPEVYLWRPSMIEKITEVLR